MTWLTVNGVGGRSTGATESKRSRRTTTSMRLVGHTTLKSCKVLPFHAMEGQREHFPIYNKVKSTTRDGPG